MSAITVESFHTVLVCREWDACVSFYRDVLEFETVDSREGFVEVRAASAALIGLIRQKTHHGPETPDETLDTHVLGEKPGHPYNSGENLRENLDTHIILSFRVEDVDAIHAILQRRWKNVTGIQLHPWGARLFEVRDPDGRRLEFWTPI